MAAEVERARAACARRWRATGKAQALTLAGIGARLPGIDRRQVAQVHLRPALRSPRAALIQAILLVVRRKHGACRRLWRDDQRRQSAASRQRQDEHGRNGRKSESES